MTSRLAISAEDLRAYARALLAAGGFPEPRADEVAEVLVWANARGMDSHGVLRIPRYVEMVELGIIAPDAVPGIVSRAGPIAVMEAARAPGATAMNAAMEAASAAAKTFGLGWCSVRNITHAGAIGFYALHAVRKGCIGIVVTASGPLMAYHGARVGSISTNPIAIAVPASGRDPIVLDMSTSNVALGKIMAARDAGQPIPADWGLTAEGEPTTDPAQVATLTPLGGPKGSGLSLMIELIASVLVSNPVIAPALAKEGAQTMNGLALAVDVAAFGPPDDFGREAARLADAIGALPPAHGVDAILMPGERGYATFRQRIAEGIPLAAGTAKRLADLARASGVPVPSALK